ncbi:membrane protein [Gordonia phage Phabuloso]|nr:membrane protein [Gordonia phage Phabuloso]
MAEQRIVTPPLGAGVIPPSAPDDVREAITNRVPGRYRGGTKHSDWEVVVFADGRVASRQTSWATATLVPAGFWACLALISYLAAWAGFLVLGAVGILTAGWAATTFIVLVVVFVVMAAWFIWWAVLRPL